MQFLTKQGMIKSIWKPIWGMDQSIMDEKIMEIVKKYCGGGLIQIILSNSRNPKEIKKVLIRPVQLKGELFYQAGVVICAGISTTILRYGVAVSMKLFVLFSSDSDIV